MQPEAVVTVLRNDVLPFYRNVDLPVGALLTDRGREFCGTENHSYELYLDLNGIDHRRTKVRTPKTNGFAERFTSLRQPGRCIQHSADHLVTPSAKPDNTHRARHQRRGLFVPLSQSWQAVRRDSHRMTRLQTLPDPRPHAALAV